MRCISIAHRQAFPSSHKPFYQFTNKKTHFYQSIANTSINLILFSARTSNPGYLLHWMWANSAFHISKKNIRLVIWLHFDKRSMHIYVSFICLRLSEFNTLSGYLNVVIASRCALCHEFWSNVEHYVKYTHSL